MLIISNKSNNGGWKKRGGLYKNIKNNLSNFKNLLLMTFIEHDNISLTKTYYPDWIQTVKILIINCLHRTAESKRLFQTQKPAARAGF
jgi:hypothetical protein